jgi:hypothetical protein
MCILILNLTMLYSYFHFSIQFFLKHTNQNSCKSKKRTHKEIVSHCL